MGRKETNQTNKTKQILQSRGVFNNASSLNAFEFFPSEHRRSPRRLHALAIQLDRCFARNSRMATKTKMGFRERLYYDARNFFRFDFWNDDVCIFVWIYEMEQFKLKVERCFPLLFNHWRPLICLLQAAQPFFIYRASVRYRSTML